MLTITLPPNLDAAITEQARINGTTPELLAVERLRERFLPAEPTPPPGGYKNMAEFLGDFIGCIDSREIVPGGANLSQDTGGKFRELMLEKYRAGKL